MEQAKVTKLPTKGTRARKLAAELVAAPQEPGARRLDVNSKLRHLLRDRGFKVTEHAPDHATYRHADGREVVAQRDAFWSTEGKGGKGATALAEVL